MSNPGCPIQRINMRILLIKAGNMSCVDNPIIKLESNVMGGGGCKYVATRQSENNVVILCENLWNDENQYQEKCHLDVL